MRLIAYQGLHATSEVVRHRHECIHRFHPLNTERGFVQWAWWLNRGAICLSAVTWLYCY